MNPDFTVLTGQYEMIIFILMAFTVAVSLIGLSLVGYFYFSSKTVLDLRKDQLDTLFEIKEVKREVIKRNKTNPNQR